MRKIKVVQVINSLRVGGAEQLVLDICKKIDRTRFDISVVCLEPGNTPIGSEVRSLGVQVEEMSCSRKNVVYRVAKTAQFLRNLAPDIIHAHLVDGGIYSRLAQVFSGRKIMITHEHNLCYQRSRFFGLPKLLEHVLSKRTECTITVSEAAKSYYVEQVKADPSKVVVMRNAVDTTLFLNLSERNACRAELDADGRTLIVTVGRLHADKDHETLLRAAAIAVESDSTLKFIIVGDGPERQRLEFLVGELRIDGYVKFLGERRDIPRILSAADIFVLTSVREGQGIVILEALVSGLPVLATQVGGIPECVSMKNSVLVPPRDPRQTAAALAEVVSGIEAGRFTRHEISDYAHKIFGIDEYMNNLEDLYVELTKKKA